MSHELGNEIDVELQQLRQLLDTHRPLVVKSGEITPSPIELSALAPMLHCFYNGVENLLKRIHQGTGGVVVRGSRWHRDLLDASARSAGSRGAIISAELAKVLAAYLQFRHVFRQAYTFELQWRKFAHLVAGCERTLERLEREIADFRARQGI